MFEIPALSDVSHQTSLLCGSFVFWFADFIFICTICFNSSALIICCFALSSLCRTCDAQSSSFPVELRLIFGASLPEMFAKLDRRLCLEEILISCENAANNAPPSSSCVQPAQQARGELDPLKLSILQGGAPAAALSLT